MPRYVDAEWRDPDDTNPLRREARRITGKRAYDPVMELHRLTPLVWTIQHVMAAERLRLDYEIGICGASVRRSEARTGRRDPEGGMLGRLDHTTRYREAMAALGACGARDIKALVIQRWSLSDIAAAEGIAVRRMSGRIEAGLTRLAEHYGLALSGGG